MCDRYPTLDTSKCGRYIAISLRARPKNLPATDWQLWPNVQCDHYFQTNGESELWRLLDCDRGQNNRHLSPNLLQSVWVGNDQLWPRASSGIHCWKDQFVVQANLIDVCAAKRFDFSVISWPDFVTVHFLVIQPCDRLSRSWSFKLFFQHQSIQVHFRCYRNMFWNFLQQSRLG